MNATAKKAPVDLLAGLLKDADQCRKEISKLQASIPVQTAQLKSLALACWQGAPEALAEAAKLRSAIADTHEQIRTREDAERDLMAQVAAKRDEEHNRTDRHLRRKATKALNALPDIARRVEGHIAGLVESIAALEAAREPLELSWKATWGPMPSILYAGSASKVLGHAAYLAFKKNKTPLPALEYYSVPGGWPGLAAFFEDSATRGGEALLSNGAKLAMPTVEADEPQPREDLTPAPPHVWTDAEIAANEAAGNPANLPLSGREWVKTKNGGVARMPELAEGHDIDPFSGEPI